MAGFPRPEVPFFRVEFMLYLDGLHEHIVSRLQLLNIPKAARVRLLDSLPAWEDKQVIALDIDREMSCNLLSEIKAAYPDVSTADDDLSRLGRVQHFMNLLNAVQLFRNLFKVAGL